VVSRPRGACHPRQGLAEARKPLEWQRLASVDVLDEAGRTPLRAPKHPEDEGVGLAPAPLPSFVHRAATSQDGRERNVKSVLGSFRRGRGGRMARLHLELLGGFSARLEDGQPCTLPTRKARALLAYLALPAGRFHSRDKLTALLWGETPEAQA